MTVKHLKRNLYVGNQRENVPPLALMGAKCVHNIGSGKKKLRQTKCVLQAI